MISRRGLIVNATGLGKDREGSPFSDKVNIPNDSYLWEFNYRWDDKLNFHNIAKQHEIDKNLKIIDGWIYLIHGWTQVMSRVFHINNISDYFDDFLEVANSKKSILNLYKNDCINCRISTNVQWVIWTIYHR